MYVSTRSQVSSAIMWLYVDVTGWYDDDDRTRELYASLHTYTALSEEKLHLVVIILIWESYVFSWWGLQVE